MSALNIGPPPSRNPLPAVLIAAFIMTGIFAALYFFYPRKASEVSISSVKLYAAQVETKGSRGTVNVIGAAPQIDRDLYVAVAIQFTNTSRFPLFLDSETLVLTSPDDSILTATAVPTSDLPNLMTTFPAITPLISAPLAYNTQVDKGQTLEATVLFHFPNQTEANWKARKAATFTLNVYHQKPQVIELPKT